MKIVLRVMGHALYQRITKALASTKSPFPRAGTEGKLINWQLVPLTPPFNSDYVENPTGELSVVIMEAQDLATIENLRMIERRESLHVRSKHGLTQEITPVVMVLGKEIPAAELLDMPEIVFDWLTEPVSLDDLVRRIFASLKRNQRLRSEHGYGVLTLLPDSRMLCYAGDTAQLTASEVAVAELFLNHFGTLIPTEDIHLLFKLSGRSTEGSNIRVTMFQLRFKIEAVTRCQFTLTNAYNSGYVMRHVNAYDSKPPAPTLEAWQETAKYDYLPPIWRPGSGSLS
ncbi:MAG: hypothetical protein LW714_02480 [Oxalobacteraceae bacterium]|jgi:DNA-binding response OmpR family regulator|nr:hypothetical protein [Oxalobacteraceae bacterium]